MIHKEGKDQPNITYYEHGKLKPLESGWTLEHSSLEGRKKSRREGDYQEENK